MAHKEGQIGSLDIIIRMLSESPELFVVVVGRRHLESAWSVEEVGGRVRGQLRILTPKRLIEQGDQRKIRDRQVYLYPDSFQRSHQTQIKDAGPPTPQ